jgi:hypothetical protein
MDPVRPWMDAGEVRRLAERLLAPTGGEPFPAPDEPFGSQFEGFTGTVTVDALPGAGTPRTAAEPPPLPTMETVATPADLGEVPRGPFLQRVQRFRDWLHEQFGARGVFLLDRDGRVIFDDGVNPKLQALARSLALASRAAAGAGNVHFKIGSDATLEVIPAETHYGAMVLGMVVVQAVSPRGVALIIDGLSRAAMPPEAMS